MNRQKLATAVLMGILLEKRYYVTKNACHVFYNLWMNSDLTTFTAECTCGKFYWATRLC